MDLPNTRLWRDDPRPASGLPSDRHPNRTECAVVLEAVKVWPGEDGVCGKVGATANLDSFSARRPEQSADRDEETALRSNKETEEGKKMRCSTETP
jgi:hypothetical protein